MQKNISTLFIAAKSNEGALEVLTNELLSYGKSVAKSIMHRYNVFNLVVEDIEDYILFVIKRIYDNFEPNIKNFNDYVTFVMYRRLTSKILEMCSVSTSQVTSLDEELDESYSFYDIIEDKNCPSIPDTVSFNEFQLRMSSPNADDDQTETKKKKVFALEQLGYSGREIMKMMRLSEGTYRYIKTLIKNDIEIEKFKMDIK